MQNPTTRRRWLTLDEGTVAVGIVALTIVLIIFAAGCADSPAVPSPIEGPQVRAAAEPQQATATATSGYHGEAQQLQHYGNWVCTEDGNHCRESQGEQSDREWERGWEFDTFELRVEGGTIRVCELARNGQRLHTNPYGSDDCPTNVALHGGAIISSIWFSKPGGALHRDPRHNHRRWTVRQITVRCGTERPSGGAMTATVQINVGRSGRWSPSAQVC